MSAPPWRLDEFVPEYRQWRKSFSPSEHTQRQVLAWARYVEENGPSENLICLDDEQQEGFEGLEPIPGTTVSVLCLVYPREGRVIVTGIRGR